MRPARLLILVARRAAAAAGCAQHPPAPARCGRGAAGARIVNVAGLWPPLRPLCGRAARCSRAGGPVPAPFVDAALHARFRRPAARRRVRPGRADQFLRRRCRRQHHHAADRRGAGARPDARDQLVAPRSRARLRQGYIREPHVAVEIETYRPFFILGEVTFPGQYPYVANMTVETAVAIAGGFTPRAKRNDRERSAAGATASDPARDRAGHHAGASRRHDHGRRALVLAAFPAERTPVR